MSNNNNDNSDPPWQAIIAISLFIIAMCQYASCLGCKDLFIPTRSTNEKNLIFRF